MHAKPLRTSDFSPFLSVVWYDQCGLQVGLPFVIHATVGRLCWHLRVAGSELYERKKTEHLVITYTLSFCHLFIYSCSPVRLKVLLCSLRLHVRIYVYVPMRWYTSMHCEDWLSVVDRFRHCQIVGILIVYSIPYEAGFCSTIAFC